jgi:DNA-binding transcriptional regulator YdaS (Cro superfamily)
MLLRAYLNTLPHGGIAAFAEKLKITPVYLSQLAAGQDGREPSPELCGVIYRESGHAVQLWELRKNDWHRIWPMLIGTDGAPAIPSEAKVG